MRACPFPVHLFAGGDPCGVSNSKFPAFLPPMAAGARKQEDRPQRRRKTKRPGEDEGDTNGNVAAAGAAPADIEDFSPQEAFKLRASLLRWYDTNHRILPWRTAAHVGGGDDQAYAVWVSEVMLQQTQVATVVGYYSRWMEKWPTVRDLAAASQEEVNEMWAGLGYYRRARFLLEGAKSIVEAGEFPRSAAALRKVRGIGDYTAGAIASIAFNEAVPVVDGNVIRVIARLKAIPANPKESATMKSIWRLAGQLVDLSRPGDFNQAFMELGATLCRRSSPGCSSCPISDQCHALALSKKFKSVQVTSYPAKVAKAKKRHDFAAVCILEIVDIDPEIFKDNNYQRIMANDYPKTFLLIKRPEEGLLAGLWEFPLVLLDGGEQTDQATRRKAINQYLKKSFDLQLRGNCNAILREDVGEYVHVFSHIRLHMYVELLIISLKGGLDTLQNEEQNTMIWKTVDDDSIEAMGLTSGVRKVYNMMKNFKHKKLLLPSRCGQTKKIKKQR